MRNQFIIAAMICVFFGNSAFARNDSKSKDASGAYRITKKESEHIRKLDNDIKSLAANLFAALQTRKLDTVIDDWDNSKYYEYKNIRIWKTGVVIMDSLYKISSGNFGGSYAYSSGSITRDYYANNNNDIDNSHEYNFKYLSGIGNDLAISETCFNWRTPGGPYQIDPPQNQYADLIAKMLGLKARLKVVMEENK